MRLQNLIIISGFLLGAVIPAVYGRMLYVATNGNDTWPGSAAQPWATPYKAGTTAVAGDTVQFKAGTYNTVFYLKNSGNATQGYITFMNYGTDTAIIDGRGLGSGWFPSLNMYFDELVSCGDVTKDNGGRSYIRLIGLDIRGWECMDGIRLRGPATNIVIRRCHVHDNNTAFSHGHAVVMNAELDAAGPIDSVWLDSNLVENCKTDGNESMTIYGEVTNFFVTNNIVHDGTNICMDMIGARPGSSYDGGAFGIPKHGLFKGNIAYNAHLWDASGIYVDGAGDTGDVGTIIIEDNVCYGNGMNGIEIGNEHAGETNGGIIIRHNISYGNGHVSVSVGGVAGTVTKCEFYNNVFIGGMWAGARTNHITFKNNIFTADNQGIISYDMSNNQNPPANYTFDYNCYWPDGAFFVWGTPQYNSFAAFKGSGQEAHGICQNPLFADTAAKDFHLQAGSPCIDHGVDVGLPYGGLAPDIGRWETGVVRAEKRDLYTVNQPLFTAQPNPFSRSIRFTGTRPLTAVAIYALNGKCVARLTNLAGSEFNWSPAASLPSGAYVVRATIIGGQTLTRKVVLSR
jgi:hypothetical protein